MLDQPTCAAPSRTKRENRISRKARRDAALMRRAWTRACITVLQHMGVFDPRVPIHEQENRFLGDGSFAKAVKWQADINARAHGFPEFDIGVINKGQVLANKETE